jgi:hypothetical protein
VRCEIWGWMLPSFRWGGDMLVAVAFNGGTARWWVRVPGGARALYARELRDLRLDLANSQVGR